MSADAWGLTPDLLDQASPFHLVLDRDLVIRQVGSSLRRLCPQVLADRALGSVLEVLSPRGAVTWESLRSRDRSLFVLAVREGNLRLRGQILYDEAAGVLVFVGSPWITDLAALPALGLTLEDFSVSDSIVDYLLLLQTQGNALAQSQSLAENLQRHSVELDARARQLERITRERESVLNSAGEGIYGLDAAGRITFVNAAAARLLGRPGEDLLGRKVDEVVHMEPAPGEPSPDEVGGADGPGHPVIGRHRRADGSWFDSELNAAPIMEDGSVAGSVVVFRDITERRAVDRMKDEFISMVSHELRTPLTSIRGALRLLESGAVGDLEPRAARMVEMAALSTERLVRLINDILEVEKMAAGKLAVHLIRSSARSLIQAGVAEIEGLARSSGVLLRVDQVDGSVVADPDRIMQTLSNLLGNAVKFSEAGATVELSATVQDGEVRFDVRDTGPGIPADQLEAIFDPFHQVDGSDTRQQGGSGLGLAICRGLVHRHGGRIWATSELGEGTTLSFTLPRAEEDVVG